MLKRFMLSLLLIFLCSLQPLSAAGPLTHAFLTDTFFRIFPEYSEEEKAAFRMGTLFPDIRYLCQLTREETHFPIFTLEDVLREPEPFISGMKFHSLVDHLRETFIVDNDYYELFSFINIDHPATYLKFLEDEIIFDSLKRDVWKNCLKEIHPDERMWELDEAVLKQWHDLLDLAFSYRPSTLIFFVHLKGEGLLDITPEEIGKWNAALTPQAESKEIQDYVSTLLKEFEYHLKGDFRPPPL